jgi:E3 ubiquitin-protein ligase RAD18
LTYALLKESALKKKLQELGIPTSGKRELLIRRHTEWLHLWNSNCDASEYKRKTKRELLKELETWERIQGGNANMPEAKVMRKDFDGAAHANAHKNQFDDLIADARKKRERANQDTEQKEESAEDGTMESMQPTDTTADGIGPDTENQRPSSVNPAKPYEGNDEALATIRAKVEETNRTGHIVSPPHNSMLGGSDSLLPSTSPEGIHPFSPPTSLKPMFSLPESPVLDVESSTIQ